jgi:hypothetical protein
MHEAKALDRIGTLGLDRWECKSCPPEDGFRYRKGLYSSLRAVPGVAHLRDF